MTLTPNDIANMAAIINAATQKGVFQAGDLEPVGKLFNKLNGMLTKIKAEQEQAGPSTSSLDSSMVPEK
mgnify:CR=1 FL=1